MQHGMFIKGPAISICTQTGGVNTMHFLAYGEGLLIICYHRDLRVGSILDGNIDLNPWFLLSIVNSYRPFHRRTYADGGCTK